MGFPQCKERFRSFLCLVFLFTAGSNSVAMAENPQIFAFNTQDMSTFKKNIDENFTRLDKNGDGFITVDEAPTAVQRTETDARGQYSPVSQEKWVGRRDLNKDGRVDKEEFHQFFVLLKRSVEGGKNAE